MTTHQNKSNQVIRNLSFFMMSAALIIFSGASSALAAESGTIQSVEEVVGMANNAFPGIVAPAGNRPSGSAISPVAEQGLEGYSLSDHQAKSSRLKDQLDNDEITAQEYADQLLASQQKLKTAERVRARSNPRPNDVRPAPETLGVQTTTGQVAPKTPAPVVEEVM